jgi:hypothetical protein
VNVLTIWYAKQRYANRYAPKHIVERVLIEATAEVVASVRMEHRGDIRRARQITNALFDELGAECADGPRWKARRVDA